MFLKSLEIFGFKSFADRTRVEFADGITALLGPNGCGKSNVVDAIKWVVGEQAARSLRAEKMEDVIFNGTESRKALGVAEVTVVVANENGLLPLDSAEVSIRRRLYRSGESEYFINGQQVKLKDLRELFWDTGVGKSAYSVMEQGKIDQILSSKPEERRYLFEEAAGITRHKLRSREAESKLSQTEENLKQVELLLVEVKRGYDSLKTQCEKTLKYRGLKDEIFESELNLTLLRLRNFNEEGARRGERLGKVEGERDQLRGQIDGLNRGLEENLDLVNGLEGQVAERQKTIYGLAVQRNGKEAQRKLIQEMLREAKAKLEQNALKLKAAQERLDGLFETKDDKLAELRDLRERMVEIDRHAKEFEERIKEASERVRRNQDESKAQDARILELEAEEMGLRRELESITDDIVAELDRRLSDSGYSSQARRQAEEELRSAIALLEIQLKGRAELFSDYRRSPEPEPGWLERAWEGFGEAGQKVAQLKALFELYQATSPSFLDDFLKPEGIITKKRALDAKVREGRSSMDGARQRIRALAEENRALGEKMEEYRATLEEQRLNHMRVKTQIDGQEESLRMLDREIQAQEGRIREIGAEIDMDEKRVANSSEELSAIDEEIVEIDDQGKRLTLELEKLERDIKLRNSDVSERQAEVKKKLERLGQLQVELEKIHLERAQIETEVRNLKDNFREAHSRDLMEFESRMYEIREPSQTIRDRLSASKAALRELGSVNFMAPEEFAEIKERYEFLSTQLEDIRKAREDLFKVTSEIRNESTELFLATYNKIKRNFHNMFRRLFGGGRAELRLADSEHVLESGIDIYAQPPGKKLENISLLSGGEKSMTAVALLFATYMVKPSPFCFLDEIDAALDEANVLRFVGALREFGQASQFVVITHNKKTVMGANTLLGVTMEESGVTKMITMRLENAPERREEAFKPQISLDEEDVAYEGGTELPSQAEVDYQKRQRRKQREETKRQAASQPSPEADGPNAAEEVDVADASENPDTADTTDTADASDVADAAENLDTADTTDTADASDNPDILSPELGEASQASDLAISPQDPPEPDSEPEAMGSNGGGEA